MEQIDAEEYTESLGQILGGSYRQIALAHRLGVPQALGLTLKEWVQQRLGGYVRMNIEDRRQAVAELTADGMSAEEIAGVVGQHATTIRGDKRANARDEAANRDNLRANAHPLAEQATRDLEAAGVTGADIDAALAEQAVEQRLRQEREIKPIVHRIVRAAIDGAQRVRAYGIHSGTAEADDYIDQLTKARAAIDEMIAAWTEARNESRMNEGR